jgi:hypothetical protein
MEAFTNPSRLAMSTILHSAAQALGWALGFIGAIVSAVAIPRLLSKAFSNPIGDLPLKQQHRLFQGYWNHLEAKERFEDLQKLEDVMLAYQDGKQPTRKQLKPYKLVVKKKLKLKDDDFKFITTRYITKQDN